MKKFLRFLLFVEVLLLLPGLWYEWTSRSERADIFLGFFTLILFFLVIPVFLYIRFKDGDFSKYRFPNRRKESSREN